MLTGRMKASGKRQKLGLITIKLSLCHNYIYWMIITFATFLNILQKNICYDLATPRATPSKRSWIESARTTRKPRAIATIPSSAPRSTSPWLCPWPVVWRSQEIFESYVKHDMILIFPQKFKPPSGTLLGMLP